MTLRNGLLLFLALTGLNFIGIPTVVRAQNLEIGVTAGGAGYMGDLNPDNPFKISGEAAGGFVKLNLDPYWSVGLHYTYGRITADDSKSSHADFQQRNLKFYTPLHEAAAIVDFNFLEYFAGGGRKRFTPYVYAGLGGVLFNPKLKIDNEVYNLRLYRTEDQYFAYRNYAVTIPYGAGVKYKLKSNLSLMANIGYRSAFTDYLDDVSGVYKRITDGNVMREYLANPALDNRSYGAQRGDSRKYDTYLFTQVGLSYTFLCKDCWAF
ncbi:DUF6089 family protein [Pedobacter sp.]|uniref:type IX secretion system protein PorG n=1 Tax=Pedobacter sp. TaxID=1411316 RepID=UPI003D7F2A53